MSQIGLGVDDFRTDGKKMVVDNKAAMLVIDSRSIFPLEN